MIKQFDIVHLFRNAGKGVSDGLRCKVLRIFPLTGQFMVERQFDGHIMTLNRSQIKTREEWKQFLGIGV